MHCLILPAQYISLSYNAFDFENGTLSDIILIVSGFLMISFYGVLFAFINKGIEQELVNLARGIFEFK